MPTLNSYAVFLCYCLWQTCLPGRNTSLRAPDSLRLRVRNTSVSAALKYKDSTPRNKLLGDIPVELFGKMNLKTEMVDAGDLELRNCTKLKVLEKNSNSGTGLAAYLKEQRAMLSAISRVVTTLADFTAIFEYFSN